MSNDTRIAADVAKAVSRRGGNVRCASRDHVTTGSAKSLMHHRGQGPLIHEGRAGDA